MSVYLSDLRNDRTKYDRGRKRSGVGKRSHPDSNMYHPILAIDGEGITDKNGRHRYVMLAASNGQYIAAQELTSGQCLDFLLNLPKRHLIVGFSITYDVCKWIGNLPKRYLSELWKSGSVRWGPYSIRWAPGKQINIRHVDGRKVHIYDTFGYFQRSFVAALDEWKVGTPEQIERIREMKASRGTFSDESTAEMLAYCQEECALLVQLVGRLRDAIIEGDIPMQQWYGAGAIAAAIMQKENVKPHMERQPPEKYSEAILSAYFGGRFELFESGYHENVYMYDIRSAYPHILSSLPCQTHLVYQDHAGYVESEYALYLCTWNLPLDTPYPPFPFRHETTRAIAYPLQGEGWYHASEVRAAMRLFEGQIVVERTISIVPHCPPECSGNPFGFIPRYYAYRNTLKQRGSQAQLTIKLGLNSLYGKTAQGVGFGDKKPPFQSYLYAGMITAGTRAMLLDAIGQNPDRIIWTATDGIASTVPLNLDEGGDLGEWEGYYADWVFCVQPGVYQVCKEGNIETRSRGFGKQETDFEKIRQAYDMSPVWGQYTYRTTRFIGLGSALSRRDFWGHFGRWKEVERKITFMPSKRIPELLLEGALLGLPVETLRHMSARPPIRNWPPAAINGQERSAPYEPKTSWIDQWERDQGDDNLDLLLDGEQP